LADEPRLWDAENAEQEAWFKDIIDDRVRNAPFYRLLGMEVRGLAPGEARMGMKAGPRIYNTSGIVHGGAIAALADAASGVAIATLVPKGSRRIITVEQKVNFMAPVRETDLTGVGKVVHHDGELAVSTAEIFDGEGNLAAKSIATHMVIPL
jgi:1,4-dihydroxy-2-naphthoyl-CoA hydrolase